MLDATFLENVKFLQQRPVVTVNNFMDDVALKILVVEDNEGLRVATLAYLEKQGHCVRGIPMAEDIDDVAADFVPDVYVVDLNLPDEDGLSLTRRLRASQPNVGIIITTARTKIGEKVLGYESGADHYLTKPVHPQELLACATALGKRQRMLSQQQKGTLSLDLASMLLNGPSGNTHLTRSDTLILSALSRAPGQTLERWQIAEIIGISNTTSPSTTTMEMRITRLRKKLVDVGATAPGIKAIHKFGYILCCPVKMTS